MKSEERQFDAVRFLRDARLVFWDFDGVIKDSLATKAIAFEKLFMPFGTEIASRVRRHHEENSGISRYEKIPLYLAWAGEPPTTAMVESLCDRFSGLVRQAVIDSPWVPGVRDYLLENYQRQRFVLVTATPQEEIEHILDRLTITTCFEEIHGAPKKKAVAMREMLEVSKLDPRLTVMVGDSGSDLEAAKWNSVPFMLRRTPFNETLQATFSGPKFEDLNHE